MNKTINRRGVLGAAVAAGVASPGFARAQDALESLKIIVGFPPGGSADVVSRHLGERLAPGFARNVAHPIDMLWNKKEPLRIDMAMLDEPARLLWAAARIARVHQSALIVHEAVQVTVGAGERLAAIVSSHLDAFPAVTNVSAFGFSSR